MGGPGSGRRPGGVRPANVGKSRWAKMSGRKRMRISQAKAKARRPKISKARELRNSLYTRM